MVFRPENRSVHASEENHRFRGGHDLLLDYFREYKKYN